MKQGSEPAPPATPLPYRDRAEVYALQDGKIWGGRYEQGNFGVYGGGIDPGEDPAEAAAREFAEESGRTVHNVRPVEGVEPFTHDWKPPYATPQQAERARSFRGSRTHYFLGDLGEPHGRPLQGPTEHREERLYTPQEALALADASSVSGSLGQVNANRRRVLEAIQKLIGPTPSLPAPRAKQATLHLVQLLRQDPLQRLGQLLGA